MTTTLRRSAKVTPCRFGCPDCGGALQADGLATVVERPLGQLDVRTRDGFTPYLVDTHHGCCRTTS